MKRYFALSLLACFATGLFAQSNIKIKNKAPEIKITDWVKNKPADVDLKGKYIVLEFWATWCGPCLAAVPHMNELQAEVQQEDLYYISITDESVDKIKRTMERIDFHSMVVSDQSLATHIAFGDGKEGLEVYPMTVLIDKEGIVQWIGEPRQLNKRILEQFLAGTLKGRNLLLQSAEKPDELKVIAEKAPAPSAFDAFRAMLKNPKRLYYFEVVESEAEMPRNMVMGHKAFFYEAVTLSNLFAELFKTPVVVPAALTEKKYRITYKNMKGDQGALQQVEAHILQSLGLEKESRKQVQAANIVRIKDPNRLKPALDTSFSAKSDAGNKLIFTAFSLPKMIEEINKLFDTTYVYEGDDEALYDFIIATKEEKKMLKSLGSYGLDWTFQEKEVEIIHLKLND